MTITGSGFVQGASNVNFVQETGAGGNPANTPSTANSPAGVIVTIPASQVTWGGCAGQSCTLSVAAPAVASGTDYFVTVTTPGGTSPYQTPQSTYLDFQVTNQGPNTVPALTGISGSNMNNGIPGGSITGGGTIALTGSGFYNASNFAAQVWFLPVGGGSAVEATNVNVASGGSLTAITPAVNSPGNYYVQVDTLGGTSTTSTSYQFNYAVQVPIIISLSPSTGTTGTQVTVTGGNFLSGSTVTLYQDNNGAQAGSGVERVGDGDEPVRTHLQRAQRHERRKLLSRGHAALSVHHLLIPAVQRVLRHLHAFLMSRNLMAGGTRRIARAACGPAGTPRELLSVGCRTASSSVPSGSSGMYRCPKGGLSALVGKPAQATRPNQVGGRRRSARELSMHLAKRSISVSNLVEGGGSTAPARRTEWSGDTLRSDVRDELRATP